MTRRVPACGDVWFVALDPTKGVEQQGARYVLVLSSQVFNRANRAALVVPITQGGEFARGHGFTATLHGTGCKTQGVVLCNQARTLDLAARQGTYVEQVPDYVITDVLARFQTIFE